MKSASTKAAGKEIKKLGIKWLNDKNAKGYDTYVKSSVDEFWAEVIVNDGQMHKLNVQKKRAEPVRSPPISLSAPPECLGTASHSQ